MGPPPQNEECCRLLFERCPEGDAEEMLSKETKSGSTPLLSAAGTGRAEVVRFLVEKGADITRRDGDGASAYDLAKAAHSTEIMAMVVPPGVKVTKISSGGGGEGSACCLIQ